MRKYVALLMAFTICLPSFAQKEKSISELSLEEITELVDLSYMFYGSNLTTVMLLFRAASMDRFNNKVLLGYANFFTEEAPPLAIIFYYYLYNKKESFNPEFNKSFMIMFSSAMNQYGWATHKQGKKQLTLGDIYDYSNFDFDIGKLKENVQKTTTDFGSIENAILYIQNLLANRAGLIEDSTDQNHSDLFKVEVTTTSMYQNWLKTYPEEIKKLDESKKK